MVFMLYFINPKRVFWLLFYYPWGFIRYKILSRTNKKLVFYPLSSLKRLLFKGRILKENWKNICSRLVSHGYMHKRTCFPGNWVSNNYWWNLRSQPHKKWCKLIRKSIDKGTTLRKIKSPLRKIFYQGLRTMRRIYHLHPCEHKALILVKKV